jgi:hypothetical protein
MVAYLLVRKVGTQISYTSLCINERGHHFQVDTKHFNTQFVTTLYNSVPHTEQFSQLRCPAAAMNGKISSATGLTGATR